MTVKQLLEEAYAENYDRWFKRMRGRNVTPEMAEDAIQDACVKALSLEHTYNTAMEFDKWFNTVLSNCLKDVINKDRRQGITTDIDPDEIQIEEQSKIHAKIIWDEVETDINTMDGNKHDILRMYFLEDRPPQEISFMLDISIDAVKSSVKRYRKELQDRYA